MDWLRLYTEIIDDPKMAKLSEKSFKIFIFLLCFAQELEENGVINRGVDDIAWRLRQPVKDVKRAIGELVALEILSNDGCLSFRKWSKRQYKSDNSAERKRHQRERDKKNMSRDMSQPEDGTSPGLEQSRAEQIQSRADSETVTSADIDEKKTAFMNNLKTALDKTKTRYPLERQQQEIIVFVQANIRNRNPDAILHCINSIIKAREKIKSLPAYLNAALKIEDGKYNAMESEKRCNEFKNMDIGSMINNIVSPI